MIDYRQLAMRLAAVIWSKGICPECGFSKVHGHALPCSKSYDLMEPYSREFEAPFIKAFEQSDNQNIKPCSTTHPLNAIARALWESETHPLLEKAGFCTDWENLAEGLKNDMRRKATIAINAYKQASVQGA